MCTNARSLGVGGIYAEWVRVVHMLQVGWIHQEFFPETSSNVLYYRRTLPTLRKNVCESKLTQCGGHDKLHPNLEVLVGTSRTTRSWVPQKGIVPPKTPVLSLLGVPTGCPYCNCLLVCIHTCMYCVCACGGQRPHGCFPLSFFILRF